jgi:hypothetical protein
MWEFLATPAARAVMLFAAIGLLIAVGAYIVSKWRGANEQYQMGANELLTNFREMHSQGVLSDEEFRNIKAKLGRKLQGELNDSDKTGKDESNEDCS